MLVHLLRRLGQSVLVLLAVSFISFMVFRHIGDPTISLLGEDATLEEREALTEELGFNKSVPLQYLHYVGKVVQGDLGISYRLKRPVAKIIAERLPATLELALTAAFFALAIGVVAGLVCYWGATGLKRWLHTDDSLDVFGVHGIGGVVGSLLTGVFASRTVSGVDGSVLTQAVGVGTVMIFSLVGTAVLLWLTGKVVPLRVDETSELEGLDIAEHREHLGS